jgi:hypothetical protein
VRQLETNRPATGDFPVRYPHAVEWFSINAGCADVLFSGFGSFFFLAATAGVGDGVSDKW